MAVSDYLVYLWFLPVMLQIVAPLVILSYWLPVSVLRKCSSIFSKQNTIATQST
jgi:hypothetical protein